MDDSQILHGVYYSTTADRLLHFAAAAAAADVDHHSRVARSECVDKIVMKKVFSV